MGSCPATYASVPSGDPCQPAGFVCAYPEGTCECSDLGGPVRIVDGGIGPRWQCEPAQSGCPSPRPDIGTPCADPGVSCDYGECSGGIALNCTDGTWQSGPVACPAIP